MEAGGEALYARVRELRQEYANAGNPITARDFATMCETLRLVGLVEVARRAAKIWDESRVVAPLQRKH